MSEKLTFEQAQGTEPLPSQLTPGIVTPEIRARLWALFYNHISKSVVRYHVSGWWVDALRAYHVERMFGAADKFSTHIREADEYLKSTIMKGNWEKVYGATEWIMRRHGCPKEIALAVSYILKECRAPYAVIDSDTIGRVTTDAEASTVARAIADTRTNRFSGAHRHLKDAVARLTAGQPAASIRESISAVESVAKVIAPDSTDLGPALTVLQKRHTIHGALGEGFKKLYGFTSDEKGIRHSLLDKGEAEVDETDALYMIGACAAFVSYLIARAGG